MCRIAGFMDFNYKGGYDLEVVIVSMRDTPIASACKKTESIISSFSAI